MINIQPEELTERFLEEFAISARKVLDPSYYPGAVSDAMMTDAGKKAAQGMDLIIGMVLRGEAAFDLFEIGLMVWWIVITRKCEELVLSRSAAESGAFSDKRLLH